MADTIARHPLTEGLKALLNDALEAPGGIPRFDVGRAPGLVRKNADGELIDGYGIIYPLTSPLWRPSMATAERVLVAAYQITLVGRNYEHVGRLSDATYDAIRGRGPGGWTHTLTTAGVTVIDRRCRERGTVTQAAGGLWEVADIYDMEVQAGA